MRFLFLALGLMCCFDAVAATARTVKTVSTSRAGTTLNPNISMASLSYTYTQDEQSTTTDETEEYTSGSNVNSEPAVDPELEEEIAKKEKERQICVGNNFGPNNTFVWAARNSNTNNYAYMIEDTTDIRNNVCFVKVQMASVDNRINLSDVPSKYFEFGRTMTCGAWVNENDLKQRILDGKKTGRVWGTVGGSVGGAAIGVGAMELFGNKLIGGKVEGQKALEQQELLRSQILVLKKSNAAEYERIITALNELETTCNNKDLWDDGDKPVDCDTEKNPFIGLRDLL